MTFLAAYVRFNKVDVVRLFSQTAMVSLSVGAVVTVFLIANVLSRDETPRPGGLYFVWTIGWRGAAYGVVDALLLSALPTSVAFALFRQDIRSAWRRASFAGLVAALAMLVTATYHLGYEQFREDGVGQPEIGNIVITLPAAISGNPLGSILAHASMHIAADIHVYETDVFLPPQTDSDD